MPTIIDILHDLGCFQISSQQRRIEVPVQLSQFVATPLLQLPEYRFGRAFEIPHRRAFPQKLRIVADIEARPCLLPGRLLKNRYHDIARGSWQDRAADYDHVPRIFVLKRFTDLLAYASDIPQIEVTIGLARSAYTNKGNLGTPDRLNGVSCGPQSARLGCVRNNFTDLRFDDRRPPFIYHVNLCFDRIDANDHMSIQS